MAENINVSLIEHRETETLKENKTNIHILINLMLDFQSFNSGPDLSPLNKSIWKTLSGGEFYLKLQSLKAISAKLNLPVQTNLSKQ